MSERYDREIICIKYDPKEIEKYLRSGHGNSWRCFQIRNISGYDHMVMIRSCLNLPIKTKVPTTSDKCSVCGVYSNELYSDGDRINNMCSDCYAKCRGH